MMYLRPAIITHEDLAAADAESAELTAMVERAHRRESRRADEAMMREVIAAALLPLPRRPITGTDWVWETHPESRMFAQVPCRLSRAKEPTP